MRWLYTITTDNGVQWSGDCAMWAAEHPHPEQVTRTRVLWVGQSWPCPGCATGGHSRRRISAGLGSSGGGRLR